MNFSGVTFTGDAYFAGVTFPPGSNFERTTFHARASFAWSTFDGKVNFDHATFNSQANFRGVTFLADADFKSITFDELADFGRSTGPGSLRFLDCKWPSQSVLIIGDTRLEIHRLDARAPLTIRTEASDHAEGEEFNSESHSISLIESTLLYPVVMGVGTRLTRSSFVSTMGLDQLRFQGDPRWQVMHHRQMLHDEIAGEPPEVLEGLYRQLRAGLEASGARPAAADFFYGEMEARRNRIPRPSFKWSEWWLLSIYKFTSGYGVRPWRSFACYFGIVFLMD